METHVLENNRRKSFSRTHGYQHHRMVFSQCCRHETERQYNLKLPVIAPGDNNDARNRDREF